MNTPNSHIEKTIQSCGNNTNRSKVLGPRVKVFLRAVMGWVTLGLCLYLLLIFIPFLVSGLRLDVSTFL